MKREFLANILYLLKKREFKKNFLKFVVFTGTAGKTISRYFVSYILKQANFLIENLPQGYTNKLGILLNSFGLQHFSFKKFSSWKEFIQKKLNEEKFVFIELGADFRKDIDWFLKKWAPFALFLTSLSDEFWIRKLEEINADKQKLLSSIDTTGFIFFNEDSENIKRLIEKTNLKTLPFGISLYKKSNVFVKAWSQNIYNLSLANLFKKRERLLLVVDDIEISLEFPFPLFEPQIYAICFGLAFLKRIDKEKFKNTLPKLKKSFSKNFPFPPNRLIISRIKNGALVLDDSYKCIPYCFNYCLDVTARIKANKKILIFSDFYPMPKNLNYFVEKFYPKLKIFDKIYFGGKRKYFDLLKEKKLPLYFFQKNEIPKISINLLQSTDANDFILLKCAKSEFFYEFKKYLY